MSTFAIFMGTVGLAVLLAVAGWKLCAALRGLEDVGDALDGLQQPHEVADRLGSLTHGQVFTSTVQRRAEIKRRAADAMRARGPARITPFKAGH